MVNKGTLLVIPDGLISNRTKDFFFFFSKKEKKRKEKEIKYAQLPKGLYYGLFGWREEGGGVEESRVV